MKKMIKKIIMKKVMLTICFVFMFHAAGQTAAAFATEAESGAKEPSNVTITVVMPEPKTVAADKAIPSAPAEEPASSLLSEKPTTLMPAEKSAALLPAKEPILSLPAEKPMPPVSAANNLYPSDVTDIRDGSDWRIVKTYELSENDKPEDIPRESFERGGWRFTLTDIIRNETANTETREHSETVTLNTDTKELEKILPMLSPSIEYKSEDGFVGLITLDVSSIKVETAGTKSSSYTKSVTREYPHLSANDTSFVPKTVTDGNATYTLASVDWRAGNYTALDYERMPEYYTAVATYTATGTTTKATGYTVSAVYTGTLAKLTQGRPVYTALFWGEEISASLEATTVAGLADPAQAETNNESGPAGISETLPSGGKTDKASGLPGTGALLAIIAVIAIVMSGVYYFIKRKVKHNA